MEKLRKKYAQKASAIHLFNFSKEPKAANEYKKLFWK